MVSEHRTSINGRIVRYLQAGLGRPMLLIHGFPFSADMWRDQLDRAPDGWRYIAADLRGFGRSTIENTAIGMDDYARDLLLLMDDLSLDRAVIGGLSLGGYIAFALQRRAPERIAGLVLADTRSTRDTDDGVSARAAALEEVRRGGLKALADRQLPKLLGKTTREERPEVVARARAMIEGNNQAGIEAAIYGLMRRPDSTSDLPAIAAPTLVIVGDEDEVTPLSDAQALNRAIRGSRLTVIPRAGHLSNLEAPDVFSTTINEWAESLP